MENIFNLSNDDVVRQNSIHKEKIEWESHVKWFKERIKNTKFPFYVAENEYGDFIGQIRFENDNGENVVSISIIKKFRGMGLSHQLINMAISQSKFSNAVAYIYDTNEPSIKAFEKTGFERSRLIKFIFTKYNRGGVKTRKSTFISKRNYVYSNTREASRCA